MTDRERLDFLVAQLSSYAYRGEPLEVASYAYENGEEKIGSWRMLGHEAETFSDVIDKAMKHAAAEPQK